VTARDNLTIHWSPDEVMEVVKNFAGLPAETARSDYKLGNDVQDWKVSLAQDDLNNSGLDDELVTPVLYRPFDTRYTYYTGNSRGFICRPRSKVMRHMLSGDNLGLSTTRSIEIQAGFEHVFVSKHITQHHSVSLKEVNYLYPLYTYPSKQEIAQGLYGPGDREPNLSPEFTADLEKRLGLRFIADGRGDLQGTFGPADVFHYIYAVFHSPDYRQRYDQFLRADFPRVPWIDDVKLFRVLVELGGQLTAVHLMESSGLNQPSARFPVAGDNVVERGYPKYYAPDQTPPGGKTPLAEGRVYISANANRNGKRGQYFEGIPPEAWEFRIGGYQPLDKWLKDRRGRNLSFDDLAHYRRMVAALLETMRLMADIDLAIAGSGDFLSLRDNSTLDSTVPFSLEDRIAENFKDIPQEEWDRVPHDLIDRLDYYLYGTDV
jgi:hypothetical protein